MNPHRFASPALVALLGLQLSCSSDGPTAPEAPLHLCHLAAGGGSIIDVPASEASAHLAHGDYFTTLAVAKDSAAPAASRFSRIGDALAAARTSRLAHGELLAGACRITIAVGSGEFRGQVRGTDARLESFPLLIDVPDVTLKGAFDMQVDYPNPRATGRIRGGASILAPTEPLVLEGGTNSQTGVSTPLVIVSGHPVGSAGHRVVVEGFVFRSGRTAADTTVGGQGVQSMRVRDLTVKGNRFEDGFTEAVDLRASGGVVELNWFGGGGGSCDLCLAGPGAFRVEANQMTGGRIVGVLIVPTLLLPVPREVEQYVLPTSAAVDVEVVNNEIRDHLRKPVGAGVRVAAVGIGAPDVIGSSRLAMRENDLLANTFALIVEGGFPVANTALRGDVELTASYNAMQGSCQADVLVSFSRHTTALGLANQPYLRGSSYRLAGVGGDAWVSHPAGFGNTLILNGQTQGNAARASYDAGKTCPPAP